MKIIIPITRPNNNNTEKEEHGWSSIIGEQESLCFKSPSDSNGESLG